MLKFSFCVVNIQEAKEQLEPPKDKIKGVFKIDLKPILFWPNPW